MDWTGDQLFACLDSGGVSPVKLNVSNDVQNLSNPVGIADAIALQGIPSTFLTTTLANVSIATNTNLTYNVGSYASLLMRLGNQVAGQKITITLVWYADAACTMLTGVADNFTLGNHPSVTMADAWEIPVRGLGLQVVSRATSQGSVSMFLQGTNRLVPTIKQILTTVTPRTFSFPTVAHNAGDVVPFTNTDGLGDYTTLNGVVEYSLGLSANTIGLQYLFTLYNSTEGSANASNASIANGAVGSFNHPNTPCRWAAFIVTTGTIGGNLTLTPAGAV